MLIRSLRVEGLRGADGAVLDDLGARVDLPPGPQGIALADAITMFGCSLHPPSFQAGVVAVGLADHPGALEVLEEDGFPVQVGWPDDLGARALLDDKAAGRHVTIAADLSLDPVLFGRLRQLAAREPRLVTALGQAPVLGIKVGWLFNANFSTASVSVLEVRVGDVGFALGSERPAWLPGVLRSVGERFGRVGWTDGAGIVAERLLAASLSSDAARRLAYQRGARALAEPPFSLGQLELVAHHDAVEARFGPRLLRARQFGPAALEALRLIEAVFVEQPDVLLVEAPGAAQSDPAEVADWLASRTDGDGATLEQVFLIPGGAPNA